MVDELVELDATDQARAVASGTGSDAEWVQAANRRLHARTATLTAVIDDRSDPMVEEAASAPIRPFGGDPLVLKDLVALHRSSDELPSGVRLPAPLVG